MRTKEEPSGRNRSEGFSFAYYRCAFKDSLSLLDQVFGRCGIFGSGVGDGSGVGVGARW